MENGYMEAGLQRKPSARQLAISHPNLEIAVQSAAGFCRAELGARGLKTPAPCPSPPSPLRRKACGQNKSRRKSHHPLTIKVGKVRSSVPALRMTLQTCAPRCRIPFLVTREEEHRLSPRSVWVS